MSEKIKPLKTPTLDRMVAVKEQSQACGEFLEWLMTEKKLTLCTKHVHCAECYTMGLTKEEFRTKYRVERQMTPGLAAMFGIASKKELSKGRFNAPQCGAGESFVMASVNIEGLLLQFFKINPDKAEMEQRAMLDNLRRINT